MYANLYRAYTLYIEFDWLNSWNRINFLFWVLWTGITNCGIVFQSLYEKSWSVCYKSQTLADSVLLFQNHLGVESVSLHLVIFYCIFSSKPLMPKRDRQKWFPLNFQKQQLQSQQSDRIKIQPIEHFVWSSIYSDSEFRNHFKNNFSHWKHIFRDISLHGI